MHERCDARACCRMASEKSAGRGSKMGSRLAECVVLLAAEEDGEGEEGEKSPGTGQAEERRHE